MNRFLLSLLLVGIAVLLLAPCPANADDYDEQVIVDTILAWTAGHECRYCTESRRPGAPDRSDYVVTPEDALAFAQAVIEVRQTYDVPIDAFLGVAWHEASFQRYAVGPGGECGMFQQSTRYMEPEQVREELQTYDARCDWLQDVRNSVLAFAMSAHRKIDEFGPAWPCAYNRGSSRIRDLGGCDTEGQDYLNDMTRSRDRLRRNLVVLQRRLEEQE